MENNIQNLNYNKIKGTSLSIKSLNKIENLCTDLMSNYVLKNKSDMLLKLVIKYFLKGIEKLDIDENNIYLIYKGGNSISNIINDSIEKLNKDISFKRSICFYDEIKKLGLSCEDDVIPFKIINHSKVKRSDEDFAIYVDYAKILGIDNKESLKLQLNYVWTNIKKKYVNIQKKISKLIEFILNNIKKYIYDKNKFKLKDIPSSYISNFISIFKEINKNTNKIIEKGDYTYNEYVYLNDDNPYYFYDKIYSKYLKDELNPGFKSNSVKFVGIGYNDKKLSLLKGFSKITSKNCAKFEDINSNQKLENKIKSINFNSGFESFDKYFYNKFTKKTLYVNDYIFYDDYRFGDKLYGFNLKNMEKEEITSTILIKKSKPTNYYVSNNYTTRISTKYVKNFHNLHRIKYNFRFYFGLPKSLILPNKEIKFFYIDIPAEFLDIPTPVLGDFDLFFTISNPDKTLELVKGHDKVLYQYSLYEFIFNLNKILFYQTEFKPWSDEKYKNRMTRLLKLVFIKILLENSTKGTYQISKFKNEITNILYNLESNKKIILNIDFLKDDVLKSLAKNIFISIKKNKNNIQEIIIFLKNILSNIDNFINLDSI